MKAPIPIDLLGPLGVQAMLHLNLNVTSDILKGMKERLKEEKRDAIRNYRDTRGIEHNEHVLWQLEELRRVDDPCDDWSDNLGNLE